MQKKSFDFLEKVYICNIEISKMCKKAVLKTSKMCKNAVLKISKMCKL